MTIEKVLPVQIEVDGENPMKCSGDCQLCEDCQSCRRYDFDIYDKRNNGKRHPDCIKDFGIPALQTDITLANQRLNKALERVRRLEEQVRSYNLSFRKLQAEIAVLQKDNQQLVNALDAQKTQNLRGINNG